MFQVPALVWLCRVSRNSRLFIDFTSIFMRLYKAKVPSGVPDLYSRLYQEHFEAFFFERFCRLINIFITDKRLL
jgi:hypothetical protein